MVQWDPPKGTKPGKWEVLCEIDGTKKKFAEYCLERMIYVEEEVDLDEGMEEYE